MDVHYDSLEVVRVGSNFRLLDPESYERRYSRSDNEALEAGLYVVHWPVGIDVRRFDETAVYFGPFKSRADAHLALAELRARFETRKDLRDLAREYSSP